MLLQELRVHSIYTGGMFTDLQWVCSSYGSSVTHLYNSGVTHLCSRNWYTSGYIDYIHCLIGGEFILSPYAMHQKHHHIEHNDTD